MIMTISLELYFKNMCVYAFIYYLIYMTIEGAIRNGQSRDTDNIGNTRDRTKQ